VSNQIEKAINVLKDKNINAILREKEYSTISNHQAVIFVLDCVDQQITQKCALVVCEKNQFYCLIVCTVSSNSFQSLNPAFDMIINSLELTYEPEPIIDFNEVLTYVLVIGVICSVVIFIIVFKMKKRKE
jgi:ABC-type enterochelin transport system permease subunit